MKNMGEVKLELGVGTKKRVKGSIGIDIIKTPYVDIIFDLNHHTLPFKDSTIDEVYCFHILEHVNDVVKLIEEIHRVCKNGAKVVIEGPHFTCNMGFGDPTHKRVFSVFTFDYFATNPTIDIAVRYTNKKFKILQKRLRFSGRPPFRTLKNIVFNRFQKFYEQNLAFIFPCTSVEFVLEVVK